jgi:hypothetical protein
VYTPEVLVVYVPVLTFGCDVTFVVLTAYVPCEDVVALDCVVGIVVETSYVPCVDLVGVVVLSGEVE